MGKARGLPFATGSILNHLELLKLEESKATFAVADKRAKQALLGVLPNI